MHEEQSRLIEGGEWARILEKIFDRPEFKEICRSTVNSGIATDAVLAKSFEAVMGYSGSRVDGFIDLLLEALEREKSPERRHANTGTTLGIVASIYFAWGVQVGMMSASGREL